MDDADDDLIGFGWRPKAERDRMRRENESLRLAEAHLRAELRDSDPVAACLAVEASAGRMAAQLQAAMRAIEKKADRVWDDCRKILDDARHLTAMLDKRLRAEEKAAHERVLNRARERIGFRVVQWRASGDDDSPLYQAIQVWTEKGWEDIPVVQVQPHENGNRFVMRPKT